MFTFQVEENLTDTLKEVASEISQLITENFNVNNIYLTHQIGRKIIFAKKNCFFMLFIHS